MKIEKKMLSKKAKIVMISLVALIFTAVFIMLTIRYLVNFSNALIEENASYLSEITEHIAINVESNINNLKLTLESVGLTIAGAKRDNENKLYLNSVREKYNFEYVGIALSDGILNSTMKSEEKDISDENYYQVAFKGESVIEFIPLKIFDDKAVSGLLFSVPIYGMESVNSAPIGVLVAMLDVKTFSESVYISSFNGQGATYVINSNGEILLQTKRLDYGNLFTVLENNKFSKGYSLAQMQSDLEADKAGFAVYSDFEVEKFMHYRHLGITDWSVVSVVEKGIITAETTQLTRELLVLGIGVVILFPLLFLFALSSILTSRANIRASHTKSAFLANMSHEIRTPMNAIVGIGEILLREDIPKEQKNYVMGIVNAGNSLLTIINDILDFSKIESGKLNVVEEEYELESLVYDIVAIIAVRLNDKPIRFVVDIDPNLPKYLTGDMIRVKQVLMNIIGNAAKFTNSGYISLGIYGERNDDKITLKMPIRDTGIGIKKEDIDKLFESFSQVDTHRNRTVEGTGLGLVISRQLCKLMGGGITVESVYGEGSTFTIQVVQKITRPDKMITPIKTSEFNLLFLEKSEIMKKHFAVCMERLHLKYTFCDDFESFSLETQTKKYTHVLANREGLHRLAEESLSLPTVIPIAILALQEQANIQDYGRTIIGPLFTIQLAAILDDNPVQSVLLQRGGIDMLSIQPLPFIKALLVDDNEVNLQVASGLMKPYYMHLDCVLSGKKALAAIDMNDYDVVFMDHMMPEMDGVEAVRHIRELDSYKKNVPVIALTANVTRGAQELFLQSGFNDFLSKPIDTVRLNVVLSKWLKDINESREKENPTVTKDFYDKLAIDGHGSSQEYIPEKKTISKFVDISAGTAMLGSEDVYRSILKTYSRSAAEKLRDLPGLVDTDIKRFTIDVHGLKGASAGVHATVIAEAAARLEQMGKDNQVQEIKVYLPEAMLILEETLAEVDKFVLANDDILSQEKPLKNGHFSSDELLEMKSAFWNFDSDQIKTLFALHGKFSYDSKETTLMTELERFFSAYDFETPVSLIEQYEKDIAN